MEYTYRKIKELRLVKSLTQRDMAKAMNTTQAGYQKIEAGKVRLTIDTIRQLADIFEVDFFELLGAGGGGLDCSALKKENEDLRKENEDLRKENTDLREVYTNFYHWHENVLDKLKFSVELIENIDDKSVDKGYQMIVDKSPEPDRWQKQTPLGILSPTLQFSSYMNKEYKKYVNEHRANPE